MVEVAKALSFDKRIARDITLLHDELTSVVAKAEVEIVAHMV